MSQLCHQLKQRQTKFPWGSIEFLQILLTNFLRVFFFARFGTTLNFSWVIQGAYLLTTDFFSVANLTGFTEWNTWLRNLRYGVFGASFPLCVGTTSFHIGKVC
jgi:hypothetical protein